jgi:hypothetical protein
MEHLMSQPPYQSEPYRGEPNSGQPYQGQPYQGQPYQGQPYQGQPYQAQPHQPAYPTPAYGDQQQGYPQQGYPQAEYPQPGYPPQGPPGFPPGVPTPGAFEPPKKSSKAVPIVLAAVVALLVLCGVAVYVLYDDTKDQIKDAAKLGTLPTDAPAVPTPAKTTPAPDRPEVSLIEPAKLGGRPKLTDPQFAGAAESVKSALAGAPGATGSIGALYGTPSKQNIVMVAGASAPVRNPARELDNTLAGVGTGGLKLSGIIEVDAGPLGGKAKCGNSGTSGVKMAVCAWADDGSIGMIAWYFKSVKNIKDEFIPLRGQVEKST